MPQRERSIIFSGRYLDVIWEQGVEYTHSRRSRGAILIIPVTTDTGDHLARERLEGR